MGLIRYSCRHIGECQKTLVLLSFGKTEFGMFACFSTLNWQSMSQLARNNMASLSIQYLRFEKTYNSHLIIIEIININKFPFQTLIVVLYNHCISSGVSHSNGLSDREVNKNNLLGGQIFIFCPKIKKNN